MNNGNGWPVPTNEGQQLAKLEQNITQEIDKITSNNLPSPDDVESVALDRMNTLLGNVTNTTLEQLVNLRNEIDALIKSLQVRNQNIRSVFKDHVEYSVDTVNATQIIGDTVRALKNKFVGANEQ
jgi:uncharacterized protein YpuA (DUF1002 family)